MSSALLHLYDRRALKLLQSLSIVPPRRAHHNTGSSCPSCDDLSAPPPARGLPRSARLVSPAWVPFPTDESGEPLVGDLNSFYFEMAAPTGLELGVHCGGKCFGDAPGDAVSAHRASLVAFGSACSAA
jgi:hypothetical protein